MEQCNNLIVRIAERLAPHVRSTGEREALLSEAFASDAPTLLGQSPWPDTPHAFAIHCATTLVNYGRLPNGQHRAVMLLAIVRTRCGYDEQQTIDRLIDEEVGLHVRFTHQLLQEYFAAVRMRTEIAAGRLKARAIWPPDRWWERTGWEEATVLLAGLASDDCTAVLDWVSPANPEVAAQCMVRSGATTPEATRRRLGLDWVPRLTDCEQGPRPEARAAAGRALGLTDLDTRRGVGLRADGLPEIDWAEVPGGSFVYQAGERRTLPTYYMGRYPITYR